MSSTSIARQNRRMRHRQLPILNASSVIPPITSSLTSNFPIDNSSYCSEDKTNIPQIPPNLSTTGCSFIDCDVSSRSIGKVFVEDERGFKILDANEIQLSSNDFSKKDSLMKESAITVAYKAAQVFQNFSHFCHGLLGGMSLIHLLLLIYLITTDLSKTETLKHFGFLSQPVHNIFNFICIICCISVFDRFDIANMKNLFNYIKGCHWNVCVVVLYPVSLLMSLSTMSVDEKLLLPNFNITQWDACVSKDSANELFYWKVLSILKCTGAILAWFLLCLDPNHNAFLQHVKDICMRNTNAEL